MSLTLEDISDRLKQFDELTIIETLEITSEMLIDRFQDIVEERADDLEEELT